MKASLDTTPARPLTATDLCDRCSSGAVVETVMTHGPLAALVRAPLRILQGRT